QDRKKDYERRGKSVAAKTPFAETQKSDRDSQSGDRQRRMRTGISESHGQRRSGERDNEEQPKPCVRGSRDPLKQRNRGEQRGQRPAHGSARERSGRCVADERSPRDKISVDRPLHVRPRGKTGSDRRRTRSWRPRSRAARSAQRSGSW